MELTNIKMPLDHSFEDLKAKVSKMLMKGEAIKDLKIIKKSIDARNKGNIVFVYSVAVNEPIQKHPEGICFNRPDYRSMTKNRPLIIGNGPAGLFAALSLAEKGLMPIIIERGKTIDKRTKDVRLFWQTGKLNIESNVQYGEGGAGTFSDGKLTTGISDVRIKKVLTEFVKAGANEDILYLAKPHIGTDKLSEVIKNIRKKIIDLGGEFRFETKLKDIVVEEAHQKNKTIENTQFIEGVILENSLGEYFFPAEYLILAIGHSSRDTLQMLYNRKVKMTAKPFSVGVRVEHPQQMIDKSQYGRFAGHNALGAAEYKLSVHLKSGIGVYTFCMCPGGLVVGAASEERHLVTNGMSYNSRSLKNANSAVLVSVSTDKFANENPLAGIEFQRQLERRAYDLGGKNYAAPVQLLGDFLKGKKSVMLGDVEPTYKPGYTLSDLSYLFTDSFLLESLKEAFIEFDKKIRGFARHDAILTAVESRSSSPVKILRDENYFTNIKGLMPCGEGGGFAGGIMSSAVDGIKCAEALEQYIFNLTQSK